MSQCPEPVPIHAVRIDPECPRLVILTDRNGADWRYLQDSAGNLLLGYPLMLSDNAYQVRVFVPAAVGQFPILLSVDRL